MRVNIVDTDKFVKVNDLQPVTNPIYFDRGHMPTDDGLFSYTIFGRPASAERKQVFSYIDLKKPFLQALVYKNLIRLNRKFEKVIIGDSSWKIEEGILVEVPNGDEDNTGLEWLYKVWDSIDFKKSDSTQATERQEFVKSFKRNEAWTTKQIVIPAHYRDINTSDLGQSGQSPKVDEINAIYAKMMRMANTLDNSDLSGFDFIGHTTRLGIQNAIIDIFNYFTGKIEKKHGVFRKSVMGKSTDFSCRSVISAPHFNQETYKDMKVTFTHSGVPLVQCLAIFFPFAMKYLQDFFEAEYGKARYITKYENGKPRRIELAKDIMTDFEYDKLEKKINQFIKSPEIRFDAINIKTVEGYLPIKFKGHMRDDSKDDTKDSSIAMRDMTWTDLFYMCACDIVRDKHVYVTRYPLEDYMGIYPSKVNVLSTFKTAPQVIDGVEYPFYPVVEKIQPERISGLFIDALQIFNGMLAALGGDYDGDQVTIRGVFTQEANAEAEKLIMSPKNILTVTGDNIRVITNEGIQSLYNMTKW